MKRPPLTSERFFVYSPAPERFPRIKPKAVIASHANEAATEGGRVNPGSRTKQFIDLVKARPVHLPLSGKTMEFDGNAKCVRGC